MHRSNGTAKIYGLPGIPMSQLCPCSAQSVRRGTIEIEGRIISREREVSRLVEKITKLEISNKVILLKRLHNDLFGSIYS